MIEVVHFNIKRRTYVLKKAQENVITSQERTRVPGRFDHRLETMEPIMKDILHNLNYGIKVKPIKIDPRYIMQK
jgi:hypothetical protein